MVSGVDGRSSGVAFVLQIAVQALVKFVLVPEKVTFFTRSLAKAKFTLYMFIKQTTRCNMQN